MKVKENDKARAELKSLENGLDRYRQGLSRLGCSRDLIIRNIEAVKRWQESFSEPLERFPGGVELIERANTEARKPYSEFQNLYESAKLEYLEIQKRLEEEIGTKKKQLISTEMASREAKGGKIDEDRDTPCGGCGADRRESSNLESCFGFSGPDRASD